MSRVGRLYSVGELDFRLDKLLILCEIVSNFAPCRLNYGGTATSRMSGAHFYISSHYGIRDVVDELKRRVSD